MFLIKHFGILGSGIFASVCNLTVGFIAFRISRKNWNLTSSNDSKSEASLGKSIFSFSLLRILLASFLSGMTLLALEVLWFRFIGLFFATHSWAFALILAMVLSGISCGGFIAAKWFTKYKEADKYLFSVIACNVILVGWLYGNFEHILSFIGKLQTNTGNLSLSAFFLVFPVAMVSAIIFTLLGKLTYQIVQVETKAAGLLALANTSGGIVGSVLAAAVFIPAFGIENTFFLLCLSYVIIMILSFKKTDITNSKANLALSCIMGILVIFSLNSFPFGKMHNYYLTIPMQKPLARHEKRIAVSEGTNETIQYLRRSLLGKTLYHTMLTNAYSMSGTGLKSKRYMKAFVYLPVAIHPEPQSAILICYGCGNTAKALTDTKTLKQIDIVDISKEVFEMSDIVFSKPEENPLKSSLSSILSLFFQTLKRKIKNSLS